MTRVNIRHLDGEASFPVSESTVIELHLDMVMVRDPYKGVDIQPLRFTNRAAASAAYRQIVQIIDSLAGSSHSCESNIEGNADGISSV